VNKTSQSSRPHPPHLLSLNFDNCTELQYEGHHSCADHRWHRISSLVASNLNTSWMYRRNSYSYRPCSASLELAFRLAYGILPGWHKSHQGIEPFCSNLRVSSDMQQVKHDVKAKLTMQASGNSGGEGARTHVQGKQAALSG
jgi:hypothetical protein